MPILAWMCPLWAKWGANRSAALLLFEKLNCVCFCERAPNRKCVMAYASGRFRPRLYIDHDISRTSLPKYTFPSVQFISYVRSCIAKMCVPMTTLPTICMWVYANGNQKYRKAHGIWFVCYMLHIIINPSVMFLICFPVWYYTFHYFLLSFYAFYFIWWVLSRTFYIIKYFVFCFCIFIVFCWMCDKSVQQSGKNFLSIFALWSSFGLFICFSLFARISSFRFLWVNTTTASCAFERDRQSKLMLLGRVENCSRPLESTSGPARIELSFMLLWKYKVESKLAANVLLTVIILF